MTLAATLTLDANFLSLREIGPWLHTTLDPVGAERRAAVLGKIELSIHELATNSIEHAIPADGKLHLSAELRDDELQVQLRDSGVPCDRGEISTPSPDNPQVRGYGMMIIEQLASSLDYQRIQDQNLWTATFNIS